MLGASVAPRSWLGERSGVMKLVLGRAGSFTGVAPKNERTPTVGRSLIIQRGYTFTLT